MARPATLLRLEGGGEIDLSPEETRFKVEDIRARALGLESRGVCDQGRLYLKTLNCDMRHVKFADATRKKRHATARDSEFDKHLPDSKHFHTSRSLHATSYSL